MVEEAAEKGDELFGDYGSRPVEQNKGWLGQGIVWAGIVVALTAIMTGGLLAEGLGFRGMLIAATVGGLIHFVIGTLQGLIGQKTKLSTAFSTRFSLGNIGSRILSIFMAISLFGWFAFQASLFGLTAGTLMEDLAGIALDVRILIVAGGLVMMITAIAGFKGLSWLSKLTVPLIIILVIEGMRRTLTYHVGFAEITTAGAIGTELSIAAGVSLVVGNNIIGDLITPDISRFSKSKKDTVLGVLFGYFIVYVPIVFTGAFFAYSFGDWNVVNVMLLNLGLGVVAAIVLIFSQWTTNDNNLYSATLSLSNIFPKIPRWKYGVITGIIGTILASIEFFQYYEEFLNLLTSTIPVLGGVMLFDYYLLDKKELYSYNNLDKLKRVNPSGIIAIVVGLIIGQLFNYGIIPGQDTIPIPLVSLFSAGILYYILVKVFRRVKPQYATAVKEDAEINKASDDISEEEAMEFNEEEIEETEEQEDSPEVISDQDDT